MCKLIAIFKKLISIRSNASHLVELGLEMCGSIVREVMFHGKDCSQRGVKQRRPPFAADCGGSGFRLVQKAERTEVRHECEVNGQ